MGTTNLSQTTVFSSKLVDGLPYNFTSNHEFHGQISLNVNVGGTTGFLDIEIQVGSIPVFRERYNFGTVSFGSVTNLHIGTGNNIALSISGTGDASWLGTSYLSGIIRTSSAYGGL